MRTRFYLDLRCYKSDSKKGAPLKLAFTKDAQTAFIPTDVRLHPNEWDSAKDRVTNLPNKKELTDQIKVLQNRFEAILLKLDTTKEYKKMSASKVREMVMSELNNEQQEETVDESLFVKSFIRFAESHTANTCKVYMHTLSRLKAYALEKMIDLDALHFEDITIEWLTKFENYLALTACKNARNIHLRNIRAVFNNAIDYEITMGYSTWGYLSDLFSGKVPISDKFLSALEKTYNINVHYVRTGEGDIFLPDPNPIDEPIEIPGESSNAWPTASSISLNTPSCLTSCHRPDG